MSLDYNKLRIQVNKVPEGQDVVHKFPELQQLPEFQLYKLSDRNRVIKYVVYAYDLGSPFVESYSSDLKKRKDAAAEAAGFERVKKTGHWPEEVQQMMNLEREEVNDMIFCYLKLLNSRTWTLIVTNEQVFSEYTRLLMEPVAYSSYTKKSEDDKSDGGEKVVKDDKKLLEAANMKSKLREECKLIAADLKVFYKELFGDNDDLKDKVAVKPIRPETMM